MILSCALGGLSAPRAALASSRLVYARAASASECPDEAALRKAVHQRLGYDAFSPWGERAILAQIEREQGGLRATLTLLDEQGLVVGSREIRTASDDCSEVVGSLALAISIALDPMQPAAQAEGEVAPAPVAAAPPEEAAAPEVATPEVAPPRDRIEPAATRRPAPRRHTSLFVEGGALAQTGVVPGPVSVAARLGVGFERTLFRLSLEVDGALPTSVTAAEGGEAHVAVFRSSLVPCWLVRSFSGCGVLVASATHSWATGVADTEAGTALSWALGARLRYELWRPAAWRLGIDLTGLKSLNKVDIYLHQQSVWTSPAWSATAGVNVIYSFL